MTDVPSSMSIHHVLPMPSEQGTFRCRASVESPDAHTVGCSDAARYRGLKQLFKWLAEEGTSQADSEWLWTGRKGKMTPSGVRQVVWRRSDLAGLDRRVHPHQLRHSKADAWLAAGGTERGLMKQMGWRSAAMVHRYAANVAERRSIEEAKRLGLGDRL